MLPSLGDSASAFQKVALWLSLGKVTSRPPCSFPGQSRLEILFLGQPLKLSDSLNWGSLRHNQVKSQPRIS